MVGGKKALVVVVVVVAAMTLQKCVSIWVYIIYDEMIKWNQHGKKIIFLCLFVFGYCFVCCSLSFFCVASWNMLLNMIYYPLNHLYALLHALFGFLFALIFGNLSSHHTAVTRNIFYAVLIHSLYWPLIEHIWSSPHGHLNRIIIYSVSCMPIYFEEATLYADSSFIIDLLYHMQNEIREKKNKIIKYMQPLNIINVFRLAV